MSSQSLSQEPYRCERYQHNQNSLNPQLEKIYIFEKGNKKDANEIAELVTNAFFQMEEYRQNGRPRLIEEEVLETMKKSVGQWYLLKDKEEQPDGTYKIGEIAAVLFYESNNEKNAYFSLFAVRADARKNGVGAYLLEKVEAIAISRGMQRICCMSSNNKRLLTYYENLGYKKVEVGTPHAPQFLKEEFIGAVYSHLMVKCFKEKLVLSSSQ